jgi:hypothetical protein
MEERKCLMLKKIAKKTTETHKSLRKVVGSGVGKPNIASDYAKMARDNRREMKALEWAEATFADIGVEEK